MGGQSAVNLDETEYAKLQEMVRQLEIVSPFGKDATSGVTPEVFAHELRERMQTLQRTGNIPGSLENEKKREVLRYDMAVIAVVIRETRLSAAEQGVFADFISKPFFTRSDFGELEYFYASAWDRLSEEGKAEMSFRIWEGVRRGEYEFTDLPENVRKKEAERLAEQLEAGMYRNITKEKRGEFLTAIEGGRTDEAHQMLNDPEFAEHVATNKTTSIETGEAKQETEGKAKDGEDRAAEERDTQAQEESSGKADMANKALLPCELEKISGDFIPPMPNR